MQPVVVEEDHREGRDPDVARRVGLRAEARPDVAAEGGQLQLNVFEPVIAACMFEAQTMFINAARTLRVHCVDGITANPEVARQYVDRSIGTVTALNPVIGYERSTELAKEAMLTGQGILELIRAKHLLTEDQIARRIKATRDTDFITRNESGRLLNAVHSIGTLGGATIDNEENYLIKKLFGGGLGVVSIENQARI